jgi:hypothetical protein
LALLATLEQRARAKGDKSIVKGVVGRLADTGAKPELIAEIAALRHKKTDAAKAIAKTNTPAKAKAKVGEIKAASPEEPVIQG